MGENNFSLINLDGLPQATADIANKLIDKISSAVGWCTEPSQIVRLAKANSKARFIEETRNLDIEHLKKNFPAPDSQTFIGRFLGEERKKQENTLSIIKKTIPFLKETAKPQDIDNDWVLNFNDKSKLISEESMQKHWARILAEEANQPQSFSKRTVNLMAEIDKRDAEAFTNLCAFKWELEEGKSYFLFIPFNFETNTSKLFTKINYETLILLSSIGLIEKQDKGYDLNFRPGEYQIKYANSSYILIFQTQARVNIGSVSLTPMGKELSKICNPEPIAGFEEYTIEALRNHQGITLNKIN
ncbi:MAG: DUF2806 domain-containing protein [Candidatus Melainabacteria bacterium]|nr:DUF2806 domain-containing protein [Candidatus Melainabacteria bacterium]